MRYRIHPDVAWRLVDGVVFLLTADSRSHQVDDDVGVAVWQALALAPAGAPLSAEELAARVAGEFEVTADEAAADIARFLSELVAAGAVQADAT